MKLKKKSARPTVIPIRPQGDGYAVDGPGFYIWDEDMHEVLRMAREFERGRVNPTSTTRFMLFREKLKAS
jgi:hypothetical protein